MSLSKTACVCSAKVGALSAAVALLAAGSASAADLFGGGATFPAQAYVGNNYNLTAPKSRLSRNTANAVTTTPIADLSPPNSVFAKLSAISGDAISYCQTGSGVGKNVLRGLDGATPAALTTAAGECGNFASATPAGFSAASAEADFIGTDAPITQADINAFLVGPRIARGALVQFPSVAGSIALPANTPAAAALNLSTQQVCEVFSARTTNWASIPGSRSTGPINIIYRDDNSGTTFAFTSFLAASCNGKFGIPLGYFKPNQSFRAAVPAVPGQPGSVAPLFAAATARQGNTQVVGFTKATADAVGYADVAEVIAQTAVYAKVNGTDPVALPTVVDLPLTALLSGQVLDPASNQPVPVTGTTQPQCLRLINPSAVPTGVVYPILAYTYLGAYYSGNAAKESSVEGLLRIFYSASTRPALPAGYAYVGGTAFAASVSAAIPSCING